MSAEQQALKLVKKLAAVMKAVHHVPKRGRNTFHNYDYATEADIVATVRQELADRDVMLIPGIGTQTREPVGEKGEFLTTLEMDFTFMDGESGETLTKAWRGAGSDKGDKGLYKAMTGAEKYFLLKTFLIPTGDDPERDSKDESKEAKRRDLATAKPDAKTKRARQPLTDGAVYLEKVVPKEKGGMEYAEIVTSTGEVLYARDHGCISLAMTLAQEGAAVMVTTHRNGRGNVEIDELARWPPKAEPTPDAAAAVL